MAMKINQLNFSPFPGLSSGHVQTFLTVFRNPGVAPPSKSWIVFLEGGDCLSCEVSVPQGWKHSGRTIVLVHGLSGSDSSNYMIRLSRKFYLQGDKVVRVNLRGCGSGKGLSRLPYHAGNSDDILQVLKQINKETPGTEVTVMGFSLGGNIVVKLAGELGEEACHFAKTFISVCAPLDLSHTMHKMMKKRNILYHNYFLSHISKQSKQWIAKKIRTLLEYDNAVTAPLWGFQGAEDYYYCCSSLRFLSKIKQTTHFLFAEDDPFINNNVLKGTAIGSHVNLWSTKYGGHLGFVGKGAKEHKFHWMDHLLINWVNGDFTSNLANVTAGV